MSLREFSESSKNGRPIALYTEFQTRPLSLSEIPFFYFPVESCFLNPYREVKVKVFLKTENSPYREQCLEFHTASF